MIKNWFGTISGLRRAGRRTNVALLMVLIAAALTGGLAFAAGTPIPARLATIVHGLFGLAVVVLVPWKTMIIRRAAALRVASLALLALISICIASGLIEVFAGYAVWWNLSPIQVHVGSAALVAPLLAWHVLHHRRQRLRRTDLSRRVLLRTGALAAAVAATYGTLEGIGRLAGSASASRIATGSHQIRADVVPATIWLFDEIPVVGNDHQVDVDGTAFTISDLASRSRTIAARLDCTSGWYADGEWTAVSLADLIPPEQLAAAASIEVVSMTGYRRRFAIDETRSLLLATGYQGVPLQAAHGAPVRLVAPHRRGFWWVKWVASVKLSDLPAWGQSPFPLQ
jgi:DMSO/TMAO reductase YedYZ molybdopterin-dependent catalytic subunit